MNKHRIFIAINLPKEVKQELSKYRWEDLPCKWTKEDNLHITLEFLGYITDEQLGEVLKETREFAEGLESFEIKLDKIVYGPSNKYVWAVGPKVEKLDLIPARNATQAKHSVAGGPHITLARIKKWDWQRIELDERPVIDEDIEITFSVNSIDVMESVLKKTGPEYTIIESFKL